MMLWMELRSRKRVDGLCQAGVVGSEGLGLRSQDDLMRVFNPARLMLILHKNTPERHPKRVNDRSSRPGCLFIAEDNSLSGSRSRDRLDRKKEQEYYSYNDLWPGIVSQLVVNRSPEHPAPTPQFISPWRI